MWFLRSRSCVEQVVVDLRVEAEEERLRDARVLEAPERVGRVLRHLLALGVEREAEEQQHLGEEVGGLHVRELLLEHRELALLELLGGEVQRARERGRVFLEDAEAEVALHALGLHRLGDAPQALAGDLVDSSSRRIHSAFSGTCTRRKRRVATVLGVEPQDRLSGRARTGEEVQDESSSRPPCSITRRTSCHRLGIVKHFPRDAVSKVAGAIVGAAGVAVVPEVGGRESADHQKGTS